MINTPENFGLQIPCKLCGLDLDNQSHVTKCIILKLRCPELLELDFEMSTIIQSKKLNEVDKFLKVYEKALRTRNTIIEEKQ